MELISTKYSNVENHLHLMLEPLKNDQLFLRYVKYLSKFPLEQQISDSTGAIINQPDLPTPYDLIGDRTILLTLFNQNIVTDAKVYIFLSHLDFDSNEIRTIMVNHRYIIDILIPYQNIQMDDKLRNVRIVDEIMKSLDNQFIAGVGRLFIRKGRDYVVNNTHQGVQLIISIENPRV